MLKKPDLKDSLHQIRKKKERAIDKFLGSDVASWRGEGGARSWRIHIKQQLECLWNMN